MMVQKLRLKPPSPVSAEMCTNEHLLTTFDHLADRVDFAIHAKLTSELMVRYSEMSKQLEDKNRALTLSDDARREAQKIAKLGNWALDIRAQNSGGQTRCIRCWIWIPLLSQVWNHIFCMSTQRIMTESIKVPQE